MKKIKWLSLLLCLALTFQCLALPASAAALTDSTEETGGDFDYEDLLPEDNKPAFGTVCIQNGCRTINGMVPLGGSDRMLDSAQAAFLYEVNTGTVIYSYNADVKLAPGNLAKIVTSLIAIEMCDLDEKILVETNNISKLPAGAINQNIKNGETLTVGQLVHMMLVVGANDAAIVIAEHISGTQQAFTTLMNNRVAQMGCTDTQFANVHGLTNAESRTTARDMARITQEAIKNKTFVELFGVKKYTIPATEKSKERTLLSSNYMIDQTVIPQFYDKRVTGGIQHFIQNTGAHLICTATEKDKGMDFIAVVMGATRIMEDNGWQPKIHGNFNEMAALLKYGFKNYKVNHILYEGMSLKQFPVSGGESNAVGQSFVNYNSVVPINATMDNLNLKFSVVDGNLTAPIAKNQLIATLEVWYRNSCMAETEVFSMGEVKALNKTGVDVRSTAVRSDDEASGILSVIGTICVIVLGLAVAYLALNAYMRSRVRARRRRRREARRRNY